MIIWPLLYDSQIHTKKESSDVLESMIPNTDTESWYLKKTVPTFSIATVNYVDFTIFVFTTAEFSSFHQQWTMKNNNQWNLIL